MYYLFIFFQIVLFICAGNCKSCEEALNNEERLKCNLLKDYSEIAVPTNKNRTVEIDVEIHPIQMEVEETESIVTVDVWFNLTWFDKKLTWNPKNYDGLQNVHMDCSKIWAASFSGVTYFGYVIQKPSPNLDCIIQFTGAVSSIGIEKINAFDNEADYTLWPYDKHEFLVVFHSRKFSIGDENIVYNYKKISNQSLIRDSEWNVENIVHWLYFDSSRVKMEVFLTRHHSIHTYTYIYPSYVLTLMVISTIWMNVLSSERLLISGLLFLTQYIYMEYFMFILPAPTITTPYIARFHKYLLLMNGYIIAWTVMTRVLADMTYESHFIIVFVKWVRSKPYLNFFLMDNVVPQPDAMENDGLEPLHHFSLLAKKQEQLKICIQFVDKIICLICSFLVVLLIIAYYPVI